MDFASFSDLIAKLGIAAFAIAGIIYVVIYLTKAHIAQMNQTQMAFMQYVETNNHQKTDLVEKSTAAIVESTEAIKQHTELSKQILQSFIASKH